MQQTTITADGLRLAQHPSPGGAVVVTRYGKPEYVVMRWDDFAPLEALIDAYLSNPPYELAASELAARALTVEEAPEGNGFDYAGLQAALEE